MTSSDAYIILNMVPDIGPGLVRRMLAYFGNPESILTASAGELAKVRGIGEKRAEALSAWRHVVDVDAELRLADRAGVQLVARDDPDYPQLLLEIPDPPLALYVRGQLNALGKASTQGLAVVGSRRHTHYGIEATQRLVRSAVQASWIIVSGLARGIDTAAHEATVEADGVTIGVIAGGLAEISPPENIPLARAMTERGAVISEQPMRMRPSKHLFPMRNRIIAGLCRGTLVVEAGVTSGALITANQALEQGRLVYAVPGRIDSPASRGCHALIKQGAKLVETIDDILDDASFLPGFELFDAEAPKAARPSAPVIDLTPEEQQLVAVIAEGDISLDQLVQRTQIPVSGLLSALSVLEIKRAIRQLPGRRYTLYTT